MDEPDPDFTLYLQALRDPELAEIYGVQETLEEDPDYVVEDEEAEEEEEEEEEEEDPEDEESDDSSVEVLWPDVPSVEDRGATASSQGVVSMIDVLDSGNSAPSQERTKEGETSDKDGTFGREEWNRNDIDGLFCPICMEAWTGGGDHQVCCLPCGHIYGMSCIKRWLLQSRSQGKCPQCNKKCTLKSIRVLYASRIVIIDEELQQKVRKLEAKTAFLEKRDGDWCKKEEEWQKREAHLCTQVNDLKERTTYLEGLLRDVQRRPSGYFPATQDKQENAIDGPIFAADVGQWGCLKSFGMLKDWQIDGARLFDMDAYGQTMVIARRLSGMGASYILTKVSLLGPHSMENIQLPLSIKVLKDVRASPHARLALLASLGRKLSIISMESNGTVLTYDLPSAAWSCTWNPDDSHYLYAGLQNGMVLEFDIRQTQGPVESMTGLTENPVHSIVSRSVDSAPGSGTRPVLTASSIGLCHWNFGSCDERPVLIPESGNQGVCISLAYGPDSGDIVASFRPKVEMTGDTDASQSMSTLSSSILGQGVQGSHVLYKRTGSRYQKLGSTCANVSEIRLPRSAIVDSMNYKSLFVSGDEVTGDLVLQELPSFMAFQRLHTPKHPIRDVKYSRILNSELLGCLSEDRLQLFSMEHSLR